MTGYTDAAAQAQLDALVTAYPYLGLFTGVSTDAGSGFTEAAFTGYARVDSTGLWSAASGSAPSTKANSGTIAFAAAGSIGSDIIAWGLFDAATAGNLKFWSYLGNFGWKPATFSLASPGVIMLPAHGFANGDKVVGSAELGSTGTLTGLTGTLLTVAGATTDTFNVGVNTGNTGGLMLRKVVPQSIVANLQVQFAAGTLVLELA